MKREMCMVLETIVNLIKEYGTFKFAKAKLPVEVEPVVSKDTLGLKIQNCSEEDLTLIALKFIPKDLRQKLLTIYKPNSEIKDAQSLDDRISMFNFKGYKAKAKNLLKIRAKKSITLSIKSDFQRSQLMGVGVVLRSINSYDNKDNRTKIIAVNFTSNGINIASKRMEFIKYSSSRIVYDCKSLNNIKTFDYQLDKVDMPTSSEYTKFKYRKFMSELKRLFIH